LLKYGRAKLGSTGVPIPNGSAEVLLSRLRQEAGPSEPRPCRPEWFNWSSGSDFDLSLAFGIAIPRWTIARRCARMRGTCRPATSHPPMPTAFGRCDRNSQSERQLQWFLRKRSIFGVYGKRVEITGKAAGVMTKFASSIPLAAAGGDHARLCLSLWLNLQGAPEVLFRCVQAWRI
jgi:hypothetical protein